MEIKIPSGWNEVSLNKYSEILSLTEDKTDNTISILIDQDIDIVKKMSKESYLEVIKKLEWVLIPPDEKRYSLVVKVNGMDYSFVNLDDLTIGERIDLHDLTKDWSDNLHGIFSILYRDVKGKRGDKDLFRDHMMIGDVYGSMVFFSIIERKSYPIIQNYLMSQTQTMKKRK